ncbi:MAG: IS1634 family transposase [Deltaproteobacteria bacterium]|nr:IS1634 family transposase [Deltaproteobacteria bacterium]
MAERIERIDSIPLIVHWLLKMRVHEIIDGIYTPHTNWEGLSYGKLAVLYLTYVLYSLTHRLSGMESWLNKHKTVIQEVTGWKIGEKEATDDRLARMVEVFGEDEEKGEKFQVQSGQHYINAYALPTEIGRYDTTSFNVFHKPNDSKDGLLQYGHSKNYRPDLLQFKQGLGTLDPAGIPLITETINGNKADDRCYVPAWRRMSETIGHTQFLYIADCKAASLETRSTIDIENGFYLFPLPMTGNTPKDLKDLVLNPPEDPQEIILEPRVADKEDKPRKVGIGFVVEKQMEAPMEDSISHKWPERWMVSRSDSHAARQKKAFKKRLAKAEEKLNHLKPKKDESADKFLARAQKILKGKKLEDTVSVKVKETITHKKKYKGRGRPGPKTPFTMIEIRHLELSIQKNESAINQHLSLAGWRIYVTNVSSDRMSLTQSTQYYRNEWLVERGFHRFKNGSLPALPLFLRLPNRIKGLMMLLTVALQALTLIEFVARRELDNRNEEIAGLVPGNPKMKTKRPTAERLLSQFDNIHLLIEENESHSTGLLIEELNPLQCLILSMLQIPASIYNLNFDRKKSVTQLKTSET